MIDWSIAQRVAALVGGQPAADAGPVGPSAAVPALPQDIDERARDYARRITDYTGLVPAHTLPAPEAVDRAGWVAANLDSMRPLLEPLADRVGGGLGSLGAAGRAVSGVVLGAQVGLLTGLLSQRVLGQYDLVLLDATAPTRLLLVTPNLVEAAAKLGVDREELVSWVAVHEVTHAVQFTGVQWLRGHLAGLVGELLEGLDVKIKPAGLLRMPERAELAGLVEAVRKGDLVSIVLGPERQAVVDRIQATMSLIEGHAEHVMDAVGAQLLPSLPALRAALDDRRATRSPAWRILERLLGLELKMRQYEQGRRFCDGVVQEGGMEALNRAWSSPQALPSLAELQSPRAWVNRTRVRELTSPDA